MKKIKAKWLIGIGMYLLFNSFSAAQSITSYKELALNFSRLNPGGSSRVQSLGGAQVSLGGDYSSAYSNPAGLGMYHRSEFTFTPGFNSSNINSTYLGNTVKDSNVKVIIPGASLVFYSPVEDRGSFLGGAFGISYNRTNNFNQSFTYEGINKDNSIIDGFIEDANGYTTSQFDSNGSQYNTPTGLAYYNYLIDSQNNLNPPGDKTLYFTDIGSIPTQHEQVVSQGSQSQVNLSYGANFNDKLFLGFGIGLTSLNYSNNKTYSETFTGDPYLNKLTLSEDITTRGSGINATLGVIYKPLDLFQLGASIVTPTSYSLSDSYQAKMSTNWKYFPYGAAYQPVGDISTDVILTDYSLSTPWKFSGGGTFFLKKYGFVTADVELINYGSNSYSSSSVSFDYDNTQIKKLYATTINYRVGAEFRLNKLRFRGGYNLMPDPNKTIQNNIDNSYQSVSIGVGYKTAKFYIDAATIFSQGNFSYRPYVVSSNLTPLVTAKQNNTLVMVTVGFPF